MLRCCCVGCCAIFGLKQGFQAVLLRTCCVGCCAVCPVCCAVALPRVRNSATNRFLVPNMYFMTVLCEVLQLCEFFLERVTQAPEMSPGQINHAPNPSPTVTQQRPKSRSAGPIRPPASPGQLYPDSLNIYSHSRISRAKASIFRVTAYASSRLSVQSATSAPSGIMTDQSARLAR